LAVPSFDPAILLTKLSSGIESFIGLYAHPIDTFEEFGES
jgi:hypothetical protein